MLECYWVVLLVKNSRCISLCIDLFFIAISLQAVKMSLMCLIILPLHYPQCYIWLGCIFDEGVSTMLGKWLRLILLVIDSCRLVKQIFVVNSLWSLKILDL
uniref:Putative ovule protein n=1 Tax=Solanum chacoense TaxID=4108 RepID=A0A0V0HB22_SOLCH